MPADERLAFGDFVLDRARRRVWRRDGTEVELTPRLLAALVLFVDSDGELLDKDVLMARLWPGLVVEENNVSQVVSALRRALGDHHHDAQFIQTVPRRGFRFIAPVTVLHEAEPPAAASAGGAAGGAAGATLAVLPLKPLHVDGHDQLLEAGLADCLATRLSAVPGLVVRSMGSAMRFAGVEQDLPRAARELDVAWIVDGSLQRQGDRLRANLRLLRTSDGTAAWSGTFDVQFTDVFAVQDQISLRAEQALRPVLESRVVASALPTAGAMPGGTRHVEAYRRYREAMAQMQLQQATGLRRSIDLFNEALNLDPGYALAWTGLSDAHWRLAMIGEATPRTAHLVADVALRRALALAPDLREARTSLAYQRYMFDYDWPGAEREFRQLIATHPNVARAHLGLGQMLLTQDRIGEGFVHVRMARELDPLNPILNALEASFLLVGGRREEGLDRLDRTLELAPQLPLAHIVRTQMHFAGQEIEEGLAAARIAAAESGGAALFEAMLAFYLGAAGRMDEARAIRQRLEDRDRDDPVTPTVLAMACVATGDVAMALSLLEHAYIQHDPRLAWTKDAPYWVSLRSEPRFDALLRALRLDGFGPGLWIP